jgi:hypothetical protein
MGSAGGWAARATVRRALQIERDTIAQLASGYERFGRIHAKQSPIKARDLSRLLNECFGSMRCGEGACSHTYIHKEEFTTVYSQGHIPITKENSAMRSHGMTNLE